MPKNIILLSDGTASSNIKNRGTNVYKLYEALDFNSDKIKQVAFYDDGVGTQALKPLKLLGGAFGWGLARNVRHLYKELVQSYKPGDKIFLFGFSRGAFTVRTLAGFICNQGILDNNVIGTTTSSTKRFFNVISSSAQQNWPFLKAFFIDLLKGNLSLSKQSPQ